MDVPAAIAITATSMVMARYGSRWSHNFDSKSLKRYYAYLCLLVAPLIPLKNYIMQKRKEEEAMEKAQVVCDDLEAENLKLGYRDCLSMEAMKQPRLLSIGPLLLSLGLHCRNNEWFLLVLEEVLLFLLVYVFLLKWYRRRLWVLLLFGLLDECEM